MKTILCGILALVFLSFNAFSQELVDNSLGSSSPQQNLNQDNAGGAGEGIGTGTTSEEYSRSATFCDNFNIPNTTVIPGWTEQAGDWQIYNHMLKNPPGELFVWKYITVNGSAQADGCITGRAIYSSPTEVKFSGLIGRYISDNNFLLFKIQDNGTAGYWNTFWVYQNFQSIASGYGNFGTDAFIQLQYTGTSVTARIDVNRDGTWDYNINANTTNTSSGLCGVAGYYSAFADDFCCGSTCDYPLVPLSDYALYFALALIAGFVAFRVYRRA